MPVDFDLYLITDRGGLPPGRSLEEQVEAALRGGVRAVQLREKALTAAELLPLARTLRRLTRRHGARLLVNREIDVALEVGADGVHLGRDAVPVAEARRRLGPGALIGVSTHAVEEIGAAAAGGADFVTFGPVFFTRSKARFGPPLGLEALARACRDAPLPVFALGGVTPELLFQLRTAGCSRVACIGAILHAEDPGRQAARFLDG